MKTRGIFICVIVLLCEVFSWRGRLLSTNLQKVYLQHTNKHPEWCNALKRPLNVKPKKEDVVPYCSSGDWSNLKNLVKTFVCQRAAEKKWDWTLSLHEFLCTFLYFILITSWLRVSPTQTDSETHSVISCHLSSLKSFLCSFKWDQSSCLLWGFICLHF